MSSSREQKGLMIAATARVVRHNGLWIVPSQTKNRKSYFVNLEKRTCTCEDFIGGTPKCKHMWAAETVERREADQAKEIPVELLPTDLELTVPKKTSYKQDWPAYNKAQINEKAMFKALLFDLCKGLITPPTDVGRPPIPVADLMFAAGFKVFSTMSARRFVKELSTAQDEGYVSRPMCYNSVLRYFYSDEMTTVTRQLIEESAQPMVNVETEFAVDSTGFPVSRYVRWHDEKLGKTRSGKDWVKVHAMAGVKTHIITSVDIRRRSAADAPMFGPLLRATAKNFKVEEVSADKAYLSKKNLIAAADVGAEVFIPFKANSVKGPGGLWDKMLCMFTLRREEFLQHYHKRSNVETVFHMIKAKFNSHVRSRTETAMKNEVLAKVLCHNICCLIQAEFEFGIIAELGKRAPVLT